ncbi:MAG: alpha/beta hydrolase fold domain-containing protein [Chthoniobacter sp.]|uniref:alpha/beta hydrolase fold domain-containing protein n=1 Tax=Chthoniobacter sp. TaxID=2510640 RepID=UPI0032A90941
MKIHHLVIVACLTGGLLHSTPVRAQAPASAGGKTLRDLAYVEGGSERQKLDLYLPDKAAAPLPLVIWIHGGGWAAGDKAGCPAQRLTGQGYAVASINYRLSGDALFPAQIEDCKAAIRWLRAHAKDYNLDPNRFGVWGSSAGGHLVALVGTSGDVKEFDKGAHLDVSSRVQAVCDYYGPTDLLQMDAHALAAAPFKHDSANSPESKLLGGAIQEHKDKAARVNPITYVTPDDPAFLIVHGDQDPLVPHHQSELLFDALKKTGVSVHFHTIHGAGHGKGFAGKNIDDMVSAFFDQSLKEKSATPRKPEALTTESTASALEPNRAAAAGTPAPAAARRGPPWEAILARDDKNQDGKVSREEFSGPPALFDRLDANHDGFITRDEHEASQAQGHGQLPATPAPAATPAPKAN